MPMPGGYQPPSTSSYVPPRGPTYPPPSTVPSNQGYPGYNYPQPQPAQQAAYPGYQQQPQRYPPYQGTPIAGYPPPIVAHNTSQQGHNNQSVVSEEEIRQSLITAVEDVMKRRIKDISDQSHVRYSIDWFSKAKVTR